MHHEKLRSCSMLAAFVSGMFGVIAHAATYYVDPAGNDALGGTSTATAWKTLARASNGPLNNGGSYAAGDQIQLIRGGIWSGQLAPKGSGASGNPVKITSYGTGNLPILNGGGVSRATLVLSNSEFWEISDLEITNAGAEQANIFGVLILATDVGQMDHVYLDNLFVHNVTGLLSTSLTAGVCFKVEGSATPTWFNDIRVTNCDLFQVDRSGIITHSSWQARGANYYPMTNVVISGNYVDSPGGDGIVPRTSIGAIVENNTVRNAASKVAGHNAGFWAFNCDNTDIRYNEAFLTQKLSGNNDGQGFDLDYQQDGTIIQYNYSHDNVGGFLLIATDGGASGFTTNCIARYNISQGDLTRIVHATGPSNGNKIYNNTLFVKAGAATKIFEATTWGGWASNLAFTNNVIYNQGTGGYTFGSATNVSFDHNLFFGAHPASEPADAAKLTSDPLFLAVGTGLSGRLTVGGYKLRSGSPALASGVLIAGNGGADYWGNAVSSSGAPNRGAYNGAGLSGVLSDNFDSYSSGSIPTGWTASSTFTPVVANTPSTTDKSISLSDNSSTNSGWIYKTFSAAQSGRSVAIFYFMQPTVYSSTRFLLKSGPTIAAALQTNGGFLCTESSSGALTNVTGYSANTWYKVTLIFDASTDQYEVWIDNIRKASNVSFYSATTSVDTLSFNSGVTGVGTTYIDKVYASPL